MFSRPMWSGPLALALLLLAALILANPVLAAPAPKAQAPSAPAPKAQAPKAPAPKAPAPVDIKDKVAALAPGALVLVIDSTGKELVAQNADAPFVPASVTKIATTWLAME